MRPRERPLSPDLGIKRADDIEGLAHAHEQGACPRPRPRTCYSTEMEKTETPRAPGSGFYHFQADATTNQGANALSGTLFSIDEVIGIWGTRFTSGDTFPAGTISDLIWLNAGQTVAVFQYNGWASPAGICGTSGAAYPCFLGIPRERVWWV